MSRHGTIAALGEAALIRGFALAGVRTVEADGAEAVRSAWRALSDEVAVVILTPEAARVLGDAVFEPGAALTVAFPPPTGAGPTGASPS